MAASRQGDLFGHDGPDPSDDDFETPVYYADPEKVREELHKILAEARAATAMPWDAQRTALYRTIFPQMSHCLPEEEGAQLRFDFETELARLEAA
jgi:tRNA nucleotidyltransferase/poly(A) polymerase